MAQINKYEYGNFNRSNNNLMLKYDAESVGGKHGQITNAIGQDDCGVAMQKTIKSIYTEELVKADEMRDAVSRGMQKHRIL